MQIGTQYALVPAARVTGGRGAPAETLVKTSKKYAADKREEVGLVRVYLRIT